MNLFIYGLRCPVTGIIRYVGKTNDPVVRLRFHRDGHGKAPKCKSWIQSIQRLGYQPLLEILEEVTDLNWQDRERFWIAQQRLLVGSKLTNICEGGRGVIVTHLTREHVLKIANANRGKKRTPEQRARMSASSPRRKSAADHLPRFAFDIQKTKEMHALLEGGLGLKEIGVRYGISKPAVWARINRAQKAFLL